MTSIALREVLKRVCFAALYVCLAGCYARYPFGDVTYSIPKVVLGMGVPCMHFPSPDIRQPGRKIIRVRGLVHPDYPMYFALNVRRNENAKGATGQPWRALKFKLSFRTVEGRVVYSQEYDLSKVVTEGFPADDEVCLWIGERDRDGFGQPPAAPALHDYDMVIDVISPSSRKSDKLEIRSSFERQGSEEVLDERKRKMALESISAE